MTILSEETVLFKLQERVMADFMTQEAAARHIGISPQMMSMVLAGKRRISPKIAEFLGYRPIVGYEVHK